MFCSFPHQPHCTLYECIPSLVCACERFYMDARSSLSSALYTVGVVIPLTRPQDRFWLQPRLDGMRKFWFITHTENFSACFPTLEAADIGLYAQAYMGSRRTLSTNEFSLSQSRSACNFIAATASLHPLLQMTSLMPLTRTL